MSHAKQYSRRELLSGLKSKEDRSKDALLIEEKFNLLGSEIVFLGVTHTRQTIQEHGLYIARRVASADLTLAEALPFTESEITKKFYDSGSLSFFQAITDYAKQHDRPIGSLDPASTLQQLLHGSISGLSATIPLSILIKAINRHYQPTKLDSRGGFNRRELIGLVGLAAANFEFNYNSPFGWFARLMVSGEEKTFKEDMTYDWSDQVLIDLYNYRNIRIADNLRRLCQQLAPFGGRRIVMIWGAGHQAPIVEYASHDHSLERAIKEVPYDIYDLLRAVEPQYYRYNSAKNKWQTIDPNDSTARDR